MVMRSTIAARAPATTSGTFVLTWPRAASAPTVAVSAAARTVVRRDDVVSSILRCLQSAARVSKNLPKMKTGTRPRLFGRDLHHRHGIGREIDRQIGTIVAGPCDRRDPIRLVERCRIVHAG